MLLLRACSSVSTVLDVAVLCWSADEIKGVLCPLSVLSRVCDCRWLARSCFRLEIEMLAVGRLRAYIAYVAKP